jgi:hypothetical protein
MELIATPPSHACECIIEVEGPRGRMRVEWKGSIAPDLAGMSRAARFRTPKKRGKLFDVRPFRTFLTLKAAFGPLQRPLKPSWSRPARLQRSIQSCRSLPTQCARAPLALAHSAPNGQGLGFRGRPPR